jgi:hypothetical protein
MVRRSIDMTKLTKPQKRVLTLLAPIVNERTFRWPGSVLGQQPHRVWPRQTMDALRRRGLVTLSHKRMGAGITHTYSHLTEAGRQALAQS